MRSKNNTNQSKLGMLGKMILSLVQSAVSPEAREKARNIASGKEEPKFYECKKLKEIFNDFRILVSGIDPNGILPDLLSYQYLLVVECEVNEQFREQKVREYLELLRDDLDDLQ
jgi:hypothetical protein